jgi:L-alanine-DL-glutamate epimerase-like enolase superfamily enzyme
MKILTRIEHWPFKKPFQITGHTFDGLDVLVVTVESNGAVGRGEAAGVYYRGETAELMASQVAKATEGLQSLDRRDLGSLLGPGGARNALDCALWELESKLAGEPVWKLAGLAQPRPLLTTITLGAEAPAQMAEGARGVGHARALKLKLLGDDQDAARVGQVRAARPDVWLGVDANQGFTRDSFHALLPALVDADVKLVEQPFPLDRDRDLDGLGSPIPIAADESVQDRHDIEKLDGRVNVINIKLDKSGGLTEALAMVTEARRLGLQVMVGNMCGTSLSAAPGFVLGQSCDVVDLDGPLFLARDRAPTVTYADGQVFCPDEVWGSPQAVAAQ